MGVGLRNAELGHGRLGRPGRGVTPWATGWVRSARGGSLRRAGSPRTRRLSGRRISPTSPCKGVTVSGGCRDRGPAPKVSFSLRPRSRALVPLGRSGDYSVATTNVVGDWRARRERVRNRTASSSQTFLSEAQKPCLPIVIPTVADGLEDFVFYLFSFTGIGPPRPGSRRCRGPVRPWAGPSKRASRSTICGAPVL